MVTKKKRLVKPKANKPKTSVNSFLKGVGPKKKAAAKKKDDKPLITLTDDPDNPQYFAHKLLRLQQAKAVAKAAEGEVKGLEGDLFDEIEQHRLASCVARKGYVGSIKLTAKGLTPPAIDAEGNVMTNDDGHVLSEDGEGGYILQAAVNPGIASYYIQNKYKQFDFYEDSDDDEIQEHYDGEATLRHEAAHALIDLFDSDDDDEQLSFEEANEMLDERFEVVNTLSFGSEVLEEDAEGNPLHPEALELLMNPILAPFLQRVSKAKPTEAFHRAAQYDPTERSIMEALNGIGLATRYKAVLKASGAPKQ